MFAAILVRKGNLAKKRKRKRTNTSFKTLCGFAV